MTIWRGDEPLARAEGRDEAQLLYKGGYREGDRIEFCVDEQHCVVQVDQAVQPARLYLPEKRFEYTLPLSGDNPLVYPPHAFGGDPALLSIRPDYSREYRNLALNPADQRIFAGAYPHITANVETRDESVFCARNVLDGLHIAAGHGRWPYQSWGIGARSDAEATLDFGREVEIDAMILYLRADFPHDAYWIQGNVETSDGYRMTFPLKMYDGPQRVALGRRVVRTIKLSHLVKCDMPSAFPALRQWEVYGRDLP